MNFNSWLDSNEIKNILGDIKKLLESEKKLFYPEMKNLLRSLSVTRFKSLKVVILGQDPYHGENQADGLAFSCSKKPFPPSLRNIFKAIKSQYKYEIDNGDLSRWSNQGVLLWNVYLTVRKNEPLSHRFKEYENLTKSLLNFISKNKRNVVFMLWGKFAQKFEKEITGDHLIIKTSHPSPLSFYRGFDKDDVFIRANKYLESKKTEQIIWK